MNEILGPIYYTFVTDGKEEEEYAEADAFFCFTGETLFCGFTGYIIKMYCKMNITAYVL